MSVVGVDERGRITLPKRLREGVKRVVIIPVGTHLVLIPLRGEPEKYAEGWLDTDRDRRELKAEAERLAREDAVKRAKRRKQL